VRPQCVHLHLQASLVLQLVLVEQDTRCSGLVEVI
jgi:hypothetical protein